MKLSAAKAAFTLTIIFAMAAHAVPPAYHGPLGNPEEPALRPYKWLFRGVLSLIAQPVMAFKDGNLKTPLIGSVETFRGLRRGAIELDESIVRGLVFAPPPHRGSWKELGYVNTVLEADPFLGHVADFLAGGYPYGVAENGLLGLGFIGNVAGAASYGRGAAELSAGVFATQAIVDLVPVYDRVEREMIEARAKEIRFQRRVQRTLRAPLETDRQRAQRMYLGDRHPSRWKNPARAAR